MMKYTKRGVLGIISVNVTEITKQKFITHLKKLKLMFHTFSMTNFDTVELLTGVFLTKKLVVMFKTKKKGYFSQMSLKIRNKNS